MQSLDSEQTAGDAVAADEDKGWRGERESGSAVYVEGAVVVRVRRHSSPPV